MESICVFGDSTGWGAWDLEKGGWVNRLWIYVGEKMDGDCKVYNLSVSGGTTETILKRFESESLIRGADALIFQSSGNDSSLLGKNGSNLVSLGKFEKNLTKIITKARKITKNIIFVSFKNVDETKTTPVSWVNIHYLNSEIKKYNEVMKRICKENDISCIDIFGLLENGDLTDGLHPNSKGHEKIYNKILRFLIEKKWMY